MAWICRRFGSGDGTPHFPHKDDYQQCFGIATRLSDDSGYVELETEGVALAFATEALSRNNVGNIFATSRVGGKAPAMEIAFVTDDVHAAFQKAVDHGAVAVSKPEEKPWGQTVAYVRDLNGFLVELATPLA